VPDLLVDGLPHFDVALSELLSAKLGDLALGLLLLALVLVAFTSSFLLKELGSQPHVQVGQASLLGVQP